MQYPGTLQKVKSTAEGYGVRTGLAEKYEMGRLRLLRVMRHCAMVHPMAQDETLIGTSEVARLMGGVSPRTVHRLVEAGRLCPVVVAPGGPAGAYLFARADVEALIAERAAS